MAEFTLMGFARFLAEGLVTMDGTRHRDMTMACRALQRASRKMLGTYQTGSSQFSSWQQLADRTMIERYRLGFPVNKPLDRTHELRRNIDYQVSEMGHEGAVGVPNRVVGNGTLRNPTRNIGEVALDLEMGAPAKNLPARSFLGLAASKNGEKLALYLGGRAASSLFGNGVVRVPDIQDL